MSMWASHAVVEKYDTLIFLSIGSKSHVALSATSKAPVELHEKTVAASWHSKMEGQRTHPKKMACFLEGERFDWIEVKRRESK